MLWSTAVLHSLRDIAKLGRRGAERKWGINPPSVWLGFDDPEIMWFLKANKSKRGPVIDKLRKEYAEAMTPTPGRVVLYFFPFSKLEAARLLKEIGK